jgi:hypothetical protein
MSGYIIDSQEEQVFSNLAAAWQGVPERILALNKLFEKPPRRISG